MAFYKHSDNFDYDDDDEAPASARKEFSAHTKSLLAYREHLISQAIDGADAKLPGAPLAKAIYSGRPNSMSEYDHQRRGATSPLGGVAKR
jgi:hypothetical protein